MTNPQFEPPPAQPRRRGITGRDITIAIVVILAVVFVFENNKSVKIRFLVPEVKAPLWVALAITFVLGALVGWFLQRRRTRR